MHLINGLYDCHRSRVPVLAIAAQIPSHELGSQYFQETRPEILFQDCSHYCELISSAAQMPRMLGLAIQSAIGRRGVSVITISGDVSMLEAPTQEPWLFSNVSQRRRSGRPRRISGISRRCSIAAKKSPFSAARGARAPTRN